MSYYVVNLCECEIVGGGCPNYAAAFGLLVDAIDESGGFYTEDDFAIMDEEEYEQYINS